MSDQFDLTWEAGPTPVPVLRLRGRLDAAAAERMQAEALKSLKEADQHHLVVDLAGVDFVASTGLATFLLLTEEYAEVKGSIVFVNATNEVLQVISLLNIDRFLDLEASEESAFASIGV